MFIAMNRFHVARGNEKAFEQVWAGRDSRLAEVPGVLEFHLLRGPGEDEHTLYASHTVWASREHFEDWTRSEAFRAATVTLATASGCMWAGRVRGFRGGAAPGVRAGGLTGSAMRTGKSPVGVNRAVSAGRSPWVMHARRLNG